MHGTRNQDDLDWTELEQGETAFRRKQLDEAANGEQLGCSLYVLPPGSKSWPYHYHTANEEAIYVLDKEGTIRLTGEPRALRPGDYVALPADESGAHRVENDSEEPLRFLALSTMQEPDVTVFLDSGKLGVFVGTAPGGRGERTLDGYYWIDDNVGYWE